jgi:hypothetical protein
LCKLPFTVSGVGSASVYPVVLSSFQPVDYTAAQLAGNHWSVSSGTVNS